MCRAMSGVLRVGTLAIFLLGATTPALACRAYLPPAERIETGYAGKTISVVALVRIERAGYISPPFGDAHPWQASATVEQLIEGSAVGETVRFEQGFGSAACDDGYAPPMPGTRWIVYYWRGDKGALRVWQAYPLVIAKAADKRSGPKMP